MGRITAAWFSCYKTDAMIRAALLLALVSAGCFNAGHRAAPRSAFAACPGEPPVVPIGWRHGFGSTLASNLPGGPHHSATDIVVTPGQDAVVEAKFAYGTVSKDLEDEDVTLWMRAGHCGVWQDLATTRTDSDGRARFTVPAGWLPEPGIYDLQLVATGDGSRADATIFRVETGARAVLFDIDGTLTTGDREVARQVLLDAEPEMYPGANRVAQRYAEAGYLVVYITGRPYMLRNSTRAWLDRRGFPPGALVTTFALREALPGARGVGGYKERILSDLIARPRIHIVHAYGNASTDVCAYARAGIPPTDTYIIGKHAGSACAGYEPTRTLHSYEDHLGELDALLGSASAPASMSAGAERE